MPTEIRILISDPDVLFSLYRWLDADIHLDPGTRIAFVQARPAPAPPRPAPPAAHPAGFVTATVVGASGLRGLSLSYAAWRQSRRSRDEPPVTFEAGPAAVTVTDASAKAIEAIAELFE
jgi:hypothetical protein